MDRRHLLLTAFFAAAATQVWAQSNRTTTVASGETLYAVAERTRQPVRALIDANRLTPPYELRAGQTLKLPPEKVHVVKAGETFADIAKRYSIDLRSLAVFNGLKRPYTVTPGQQIRLPSLVRDRYTGLEPQDLAAVLSGQIAKGARVASGPPVDPVTVPPPLPKPQPPTIPKAPQKPKAPESKATASAPQPKIPPAAPGRFRWPVEGDIVLPFGPIQAGARNDGINIAAAEGTPFRAADAGTVAYVGNELVGYGWLVLVRHEGGFITAYAHGRSVSVREGQSVARGDVLGEVGATGRVSRPQLHFEIREGTRPVNPVPLLGR